MTQLDYKRLQLHKLRLDKVLVSQIHLLAYLNMLLNDDENPDKKKTKVNENQFS